MYFMVLLRCICAEYDSIQLETVIFPWIYCLFAKMKYEFLTSASFVLHGTANWVHLCRLDGVMFPVKKTSVQLYCQTGIGMNSEQPWRQDEATALSCLSRQRFSAPRLLTFKSRQDSHTITWEFSQYWRRERGRDGERGGGGEGGREGGWRKLNI